MNTVKLIDLINKKGESFSVLFDAKNIYEPNLIFEYYSLFPSKYPNFENGNKIDFLNENVRCPSYIYLSNHVESAPKNSDEFFSQLNEFENLSNNFINSLPKEDFEGLNESSVEKYVSKFIPQWKELLEGHSDWNDFWKNYYVGINFFLKSTIDYKYFPSAVKLCEVVSEDLENFNEVEFNKYLVSKEYGLNLEELTR